LSKATKLVLLCLAVVLPAGCERAAAERNAAQLAAKVNGAEISVRQLRSAGAASAGPALEKVIESLFGAGERARSPTQPV